MLSLAFRRDRSTLIFKKVMTKKKYLPKIILGLLLISGFTQFAGFISTKSEFWIIVTYLSFAVATYLLFKLTECRVFLVSLYFDLLYFGNKLLNDYGLKVGDIWENIISVAEYILIILTVVVYLKERKILHKKIKDILYPTSGHDINHDIQLNKLTKREILLIIITILLTIIVITGLIEYGNLRATQEVRPIPLIILGILLFILIIIIIILRKDYKQFSW